MALLRKAAFALIALTVLIIVTLLTCIVLALPINLTPLHGLLEEGLAGVLARPVSISGAEWRPGLKSELTLTEIRIGNPHGWAGKEEFARIARVQLQFDLLSLLQGELSLHAVHGDQIELLLARDKVGKRNWKLQIPNSTTAKSTARSLTLPDDLSLRQVHVHYRAAEDTASTQLLQLQEVNASTAPNAALQLKMAGQCLQIPCELSAQFYRTGSRFQLDQVRGQMGDAALSAQATLDLSDEGMLLSTQAGVSALDVEILRPWWRDLELSGTVESIKLQAISQGSDIEALLYGLDLKLEAASARLKLERTGQTALMIDLNQPELALTPSQPLSLRAAGTLNGQALDVNLESDLMRPDSSRALPVQLLAAIGQDKVRAAGHIRPIAGPLTLDLQIDIEGPNIGSLAALFGAPDMPALPYRLRAGLQKKGTDLMLNELEATVGANTISGKFSVSAFGRAAPQLMVSLHAPTLNLKDHSTAEAEAIIPLDEATLEQAQKTEVDLGLDKARIRQIQTALTRLGFDTRGVDGIFGKNTRRAIAAFQNNLQALPSGYLTAGQLAKLLDESTASATVGPSGLLDQVLPTGLKRLEANIELAIERLILPGDIQISGFDFKGQFRSGHLERSSLRGGLGKNRFDGTLTLVVREQPAKAQLDLAAQHVDFGELLRDLGMMDNLNLSGGPFKAEAKAQGATLRELLAGVALNATLADSHWTLKQDDGKTTVLELTHVRLQSLPGQPVMIDSEAQLNGQSLTLTLQSERRAASFLNLEERLQLSVKAAAAELVLNTTLDMLVNRSPRSAQLTLSGSRLNRLGSLLSVTLPPLGPYTLTGELRIGESDYRLENVELHIGASDLHGRLLLALDHKTPRLELELNADQLRLEDIGLDLRQANRSTAAAGQPIQGPHAQPSMSDNERIDRSQRSLDQWLLSDSIRRLNVRIDLDAQRLMLGGDELGPLSISAALQDGRLTLQKGRMQLADGSMNLQLDMQPQANRLNTKLSALVDRLDYGRIARLWQPQTQLRGQLSLAAALSGQAPSFDTFSAHTSGSVRFLLTPQALEAGSLTLWELNLLTLLLPKLDDSGSTINCVAGRLRFDQGIVKLRPGDLLIDTSKVRASGEGEVNFKTRHLDLTLVPRVKSPRALDLATAVQVRGSFDEFGATLSGGHLIKTLVSLPLGLNRLWLRFFNGRDVPPADGSDICSRLPAPVAAGTQTDEGPP